MKTGGTKQTESIRKPPTKYLASQITNMTSRWESIDHSSHRTEGLKRFAAPNAKVFEEAELMKPIRVRFLQVGQNEESVLTAGC